MRSIGVILLVSFLLSTWGVILQAEVQEIEPQALRSFMKKNPGTQLVDVREGWERRRAKIPKSKHIAILEISNAKNMLDLDKPVITYCKSGPRSQNAADMLKKIGFTEVYTLRGGIEAYSIEVDSSIPRY